MVIKNSLNHDEQELKVNNSLPQKDLKVVEDVVKDK